MRAVLRVACLRATTLCGASRPVGLSTAPPKDSKDTDAPDASEDMPRTFSEATEFSESLKRASALHIPLTDRTTEKARCLRLGATVCCATGAPQCAPARRALDTHPRSVGRPSTCS